MLSRWVGEHIVFAVQPRTMALSPSSGLEVGEILAGSVFPKKLTPAER